MIAADFIDPGTKERIERLGTKREINVRFVQWLPKAPDGAYNEFLKILKKTNQSHLAHLLNEWGEDSN